MGKEEWRQGEWRQGWPAVAAGAVGMGAGIGLYTMVAGLFVRPLEVEFGWSRSEIAFAGIFALVGSFVLPIIGALIDRVGSRWVAAAGMVLLTLGYLLLSSLSGTLWEFYLVILVFAITGMATSPIVFTQVVNRWFNRQRGLALGVTLSGVTLSSILMLPLLAQVIASHGWRIAFLVLAAVPLLFGLPVVASWLKRPERELWRSEAGDGIDEGIQDAPDRELFAVLRDARFWLLGGGLFCANIAVGGILSQLQPLLAESGFSATLAATLGSVFAAAIAVGRLGSGWLLDRFWPPAVAALFLLSPLFGITILLSMEQPIFLTGALAVIFFGLAQGAEVDFLAFLIPHYFGLGNYGKIFGVLAMLVACSLALGGICFGYIFDRFGSYDPALKGAVLAYLGGAGGLLLSGLITRDVNLNALPDPSE